MFIANSVDKKTSEQLMKRQNEIHKRREKEERKSALTRPSKTSCCCAISQSELAVESSTFAELSIDSFPSVDFSVEDDDD